MRPEILRKEKMIGTRRSFLTKKINHTSNTGSKEPHNALLLIVVQKQSFRREPILLDSTGLIKNSEEDPSPYRPPG